MARQPGHPEARPDHILTQQEIDAFFHRFSTEASLGLSPAMQFDTLISLIRPLYTNHISSLRETHLGDRIEAQAVAAQREGHFRQELDSLKSGHTEALHQLQDKLRMTESLNGGLREREVQSVEQLQLLQAQLRDREAQDAQQLQVLRMTQSLNGGFREREVQSAEQLQVLQQRLQGCEAQHAQQLQVLQQRLQDCEAQHAQQLQVLQQRLQDCEAQHGQQLQVLQQRLRDCEAQYAQQLQLLQQRLLDCQEQLRRTDAQHSSECVRLQAIFESGSRLLVSQLNTANMMAQQSGARLENYMLRQPMQAKPVLKGSQSRAVTWDKLKRIPGNLFDRKLPVNQVTAARMKQITAQVPLLVQSFDFHHEPETYPFICELLHTALNHDRDIAGVYDTSKLPYLNGCKPDLTITLPGLIEPDSGSVCIIVEIKLGSMKSANAPGEVKNFGTSSDFGQLYDYLLAVQFAQAGRRTCVGLLSDIDRNYVVTLGMGESGAQVTHYAAESIYGVLAYITDIALKDKSYLPPLLGFSPGLGNMRRRLGNPRNHIVGEFLVPAGAPGTVMAVKLTTIKTRETFFLNMFKADAKPHPSLPSLVHNLDDEDLEYGITPVGTQLHPSMLPSPRQTRKILTDITSAVSWLHARHIVHRDIRCENIILNDIQAVLIDFDCAYHLQWSVPTDYRGGHICIPPAHLGGVIKEGWAFKYIPSLSDDCYAVVLLAYMLLFPHRFADFRASKIAEPGSSAGPAMVAFWDDLAASWLWNEFLELAKAGVVGALNLEEIFY